MPDETTDSGKLIENALGGDPQALAEVFAHFRPRLKRMIRLRLDRRLSGRVDASDVVQEAYLDVAQRMAEYATHRDYPFFLWLRLITGQRLAEVHRRHLGTAMRNADLEVSIYRGALPQASTMFLASQLLGRFTSVSEKAAKAEVQVKLQEVLNSMDATDREVLALRHFEEMSNDETAQILEISAAAASKRYIRALRRMKDALAHFPGIFNSS
jgi:RNA polymerase sigma-70 factor, ECF subfamily